MKRRHFFLVGLASAGAAVATVAGRDYLYLALSQDVAFRLDAETAHRRATAGELLLVDIRRPDEWASTGTPVGAARLDMRRTDFADELAELADGDLGAPIALICARGVRSSRLANELAEKGFLRIYDVPEGLLGSAAGPGWIRSGLPLDGG